MSTSTPKVPPQTAAWFFDVISPFSYLALGEIEELARTITIVYRPVLFAALLSHWKHLGPAEIPPKRLHTYRLCIFEAERRGIRFRFPPSHPFNPLRPLRLIAARDAAPSAVRTVMDKIWRGMGSTFRRRKIGVPPAPRSGSTSNPPMRSSTRPRRSPSYGPARRLRLRQNCSACRPCRSARSCSGASMRCRWRALISTIPTCSSPARCCGWRRSARHRRARHPLSSP